MRLLIKFKRLKPKQKYGKVGRPSKKQIQKLRRRRIATVGALIAAGLAGSVYFGLSVLRSPALPLVYSPPVPEVVESVTVDSSAKQLAKSEPTELKIADADIDTALITVGRNADGTMEVPDPTSAAGWYQHGPTPGEIGPAIIVGHVDDQDGPAIFWGLRELALGQIIEIKRADGTTIKFKVTGVKQFEQDNFPTNDVYGNIDHAGLRLITCGGSFDRLKQRYSHNTVVYAALVI